MHFITLLSIAFSAAACVTAIVIPARSDSLFETEGGRPATHRRPQPELKVLLGSTSTDETGGVATVSLREVDAAACGDLTAAVGSERYGDLGEVAKLCGRQVAVTSTDDTGIADALNSVTLPEGTSSEVRMDGPVEVSV